MNDITPKIFKTLSLHQEAKSLNEKPKLKDVFNSKLHNCLRSYGKFKCGFSQYVYFGKDLSMYPTGLPRLIVITAGNSIVQIAMFRLNPYFLVNAVTFLCKRVRQ